MIFEKYRSIENSYRQEFINKIMNEGKGGGLWVLHEKIHGSNFSIWYDGATVRFASRSGFIGEESSFFGFQKHIETMKQFVKNIWAMINGSVEYGEVKSIAVFGELFGGSYNHPDVPKTQSSSVQKGVYYSPNLEFMAFDITVNDKYIPVSEATQYVVAAGHYKFAPQLFAGTLEQCLNYPNLFDTVVPSILGYPAIANNTCEGVVIRPNENRELFNSDRIILKNKNEKFKEKAEAPTKPKLIEPASDELIAFLGEVQAYVNQPRVANVASKIGEVNMKDFPKVHKALMEDARESYSKDGLTEAILSDEDRVKFGKLFGKICAEATKVFLMEKEKQG